MPKKKHRTISCFYKGNKTNHKLLSFICHESKNIYNQYLFCANIFYKYKTHIYQKILDKKIIGKVDDYIISKLIKLHQFISNHQEKIKNNYHILKDIINDNFYDEIYHDNINYYINFVCNNISDIDELYLDEKFNQILIYQPVKEIVNAIYRKKFFKLKDKNLKEINNKFIEHVQENKIIPYDNITTKKLKEQGCVLTSEQNLLKRFAYLYIKQDMKLSSDIVINIINKAHGNISSFYALKNLGLKVKFPRYLDYNGMYIVPFYERSRKLEDDYVRLSLGGYVRDNFII